MMTLKSFYTFYTCDNTACCKEINGPCISLFIPNHHHVGVPDCSPPSYYYDFCSLTCLDTWTTNKQISERESKLTPKVKVITDMDVFED